MPITEVSLPELQEIGALGDALEFARCIGQHQVLNWKNPADAEVKERYEDAMDAILVAMAVDINWVQYEIADDDKQARWYRSISRHYEKLWAKYRDAYNIERRKR